MNDEAGGRRHWYVPDAYLPGDSSHGVESHESACLLNAGSRPAVVSLTFFFEDRDPVGPVEVTVESRRTRHVVLPRDVPFAYTAECDVPIVLQHSRLDTSAGAYTLGTTIAYGE